MILALSLLIFLLMRVAQIYAGLEEKYLYAVMKPDEFWPIIEFKPDEFTKADENYTPPVFLTNMYTSNRVVEFYAPWCGHCQHFKQQYIDFGRNCTKMATGYGVNIEFYAVSCTANPSICKAENVHSYPTVKLLSSGKANGTVVPSWQVHCFTALKMFGANVPEVPLQSDVPKKFVGGSVSEVSIQQVHDSRTKQQIYDDALLSFDFAMRHSIFMSNGPLSNKSADVFEDWIELLSNALPPIWSIHDTLKSISKDIKEVLKSENKLIAILSEHQPKSKKWSLGCPAGYTCGLWELFHILSIGVVEWNQLAAIEGAIFTAENVADTLHDYISEFFACSICRQHFIMDYANCKHNRCTRLGNSKTDLKEWKQLVLWLWEAHNDVRVRLAHEKAERENRQLSEKEEQLAEWPSRFDCPICWNGDGSWDDDLIYKYLRMTYWIEDSISIQYRDEFSHRNKRQLDSLQRHDFEGDKLQFSYFPFAILLSILLMGCIYTFHKQAERVRTGRHKKSDLA